MDNVDGVDVLFMCGGCFVDVWWRFCGRVVDFLWMMQKFCGRVVDVVWIMWMVLTFC